MKKLIVLLTVLALAAALSFAPAASAHEENEAEAASSEHFLGINWDAPWMGRALVWPRGGRRRRLRHPAQIDASQTHRPGSLE